MNEQMNETAETVRELAKSVMGFSWAMSVFGAQQVAAVLRPADTPEGRAAAVSRIEELTSSVTGQLSDSMAARFQAGDQWQRRLVDVAFALPTIDPAQGLQVGLAIVQRSFDTLRTVASGQMNSTSDPTRVD